MTTKNMIDGPPELVRSPMHFPPSKENEDGTVEETPYAKDQARLVSASPEFRTQTSFRLSLRDLAVETLSGNRRFWLVIVGIAALFDFAATVLVEYLPPKEPNIEVVARRLFFLPRKRKQEMDLVDEHWFVEFLRWLDKWSVIIGILFSVLWFTDAFVRASWKRDERLRDLDRARCLEIKDDDEKSDEDSEDDEWSGAWGPYYRTISIQLVLLPVGFFLLVWHVLRVAVGDASEEEDEKIDIVFTDDEGNVEEEHIFTTRSTVSLCFALFQYSAASLLRVTGTRLRAKIRAIQFRTIRRLLTRAIRHPRQFRRRVQRLLVFVRWFTYLAPLLGACNKLFGNFLDLLKKYRQHRTAEKASRARRILWRKLTPEELREAAAVIIQSQWRAHRSRRMFWLLRIMTGEREALAASRVQRIARGMISRARTRLMKKKYELQRLHKQKKVKQTRLSLEERKRMYKLQEELKLEAEDLVNRKLLLRPNTRFAVTWKVLFVICIILEIAQLACKPTLSKFRDEATNEPLGLGKVLEQKLVPTPLSQYEECEGWLKKTQLEIKRRKHRKKQKKGDEHRPWFCREPYVTSQWVYMEALRVFLTETLVVVGIVCYLDVFVTFFTGELDPDTGSLVPKPVVTRWVLPGLVLQMLVNPQMETTSHYVGVLMARIVDLGPVRVWRWSAALFFPLFHLAVFCLEQYIWLPLVYKQNEVVQR